MDMWGPQILNKARAKQADRQGGREEAPIEASGPGQPGQGVVIRGSCRAAEWAGQKGGRRKIERRRALASFSLSLSLSLSLAVHPAHCLRWPADPTCAFFISLFVWTLFGEGTLLLSSSLSEAKVSIQSERGIAKGRKAKPNLSASSIKHGHTEERRGVERGAGPGPSIDQLRGIRSNSLGEEEEEVEE